MAICMLVSCRSLTADQEAAYGIAERIVPDYVRNIRFEMLDKDGKDRFELEQDGNMLVIRGNNANSMAVGLNHFLKYWCLSDVSWFADDPVVVPDRMPRVEGKVSESAVVDNRFFLNYCTFGYTMVWWEWKDWERLIDWMALNGINLPLATTGQEAVWKKVWLELGLTDSQISSYFTGPAHLPWHRMLNLDYWQSGIPQTWLDSQVELQKKIIARERSLNMRPVLPAFAGHVPAELAELYPDAKISTMSPWGGFEDKYRSHYLNPGDSLFNKIQRLFIEEQTRLFGTDHIYGIDPFNEVQPPSWEPEFLADAAGMIYGSVADVDKDAVWLQMTWMFYIDRALWTDERIEAYLGAVPEDRMILLDYYCENTEVWSQTSSYYGRPYIWCYLGNFGGNTMLAGDIEEVSERICRVMKDGGSNFCGIGSTLEALDVNPFMYEYVFESAWTGMAETDDWICALADRYLGREDDLYRETWKLLADSVYTAPAHLGQGPLTNARPSLEGHSNWTTDPSFSYSNGLLFDVWRKMLDAGPSDRDGYEFWIVNVGRQALSNLFMDYRDEFSAAVRCRDLDGAAEMRDKMLGLLADIDELVSCHPTFSFGRWTKAASMAGTTPEESAYFVRNARTLLTTWGDRDQSLNDYANRTWSGLVSGYYAKRWKMFLDAAVGSLESSVLFDEEATVEKIKDFEKEFATSSATVSVPEDADAVDVAERLYEKYVK